MTAVKKVLMLIFFILLLIGCSNEEKEKKLVEEVEETSSHQEDGKKEEVEEVSIVEETVALPIEPQYEINPNTWSVEPTGDSSANVVLLTIDDAPDKYSLEMAKTLERIGVKAIFFVNGHFIDTEEEAERLKAIHELGFPIGNHTYSHSNLSKLSEAEQRKEIVALNDRVEEIIGERPKFFRAPFGVNTDFSRKIAEEEKMLIMNWTYGYDWEKDYQSKEAIGEIMVNTPFLKNGANLLMHDRAWTHEALENIVNGIKGKGFEIVDPVSIKTPK